MYYSIFNKENGHYLVHPEVGLWFTTEKKEADAMLLSAKEYVSAIGMSELCKAFQVVELTELPNIPK